MSKKNKRKNKNQHPPLVTLQLGQQQQVSSDGSKVWGISCLSIPDFDSSSISFTDQPVIPPERIQFTDRSADELYQSNDQGTEPEIIVLDAPDDSAAGDGWTKR